MQLTTVKLNQGSTEHKGQGLKFQGSNCDARRGAYRRSHVYECRCRSFGPLPMPVS
ncbi:hypothetical protein SOVF_009390 [Spinacia oleracea]|nr:hypothetical protein SOVF_009390 [Spinacia oleracea]